MPFNSIIRFSLISTLLAAGSSPIYSWCILSPMAFFDYGEERAIVVWAMNSMAKIAKDVELQPVVASLTL